MATLRDFYMRSEEDPKYKGKTLEVTDQTEEAISQIRMTLLTEKGSVLGEPDFGLDVNKYLFDFDGNPFGLSNEANSQIDKYVSASKLKQINVNPSRFSDEKNRDVFVLEINIDGDAPFALFYD